MRSIGRSFISGISPLICGAPCVGGTLLLVLLCKLSMPASSSSESPRSDSEKGEILISSSSLEAGGNSADGRAFSSPKLSIPAISSSDRNLATGESRPSAVTFIHTRPLAPSDLARSVRPSSLLRP